MWLFESLKFHLWFALCQGFPNGSDGKESTCNARDLGSIPGLGRSPGEGNGNPLQYSFLENPMDGRAWQAIIHGVSKSRTRLNDFTFTFHFHALEKKWQPTPVFLPGEAQGRESLVGCRLWGRTESDMTERLHYEPLISICFCPQRNMLLSLLQALAHAMSGNPRLKT